MSAAPGRNPEFSVFRKAQLSSDAKIILALLKKQPQTREELCRNTSISGSTFYRMNALLIEQHVIKCVDGMYALWSFDSVEKKIEDAFFKFINENKIIYPDYIVDEVGKPWPEIQAQTYKIAKKLGLTITKAGNDTIFIKTT